LRITINFFSVLLTILAFSVNAAYSLDATNLVAAWGFDTDGDASDISGNGHDGTADGDVNWAAGKFGSAVELDGTGAIVIEHDEALSLETFTLVAWVNLPSAPTDWWTIVAKDGWPNRNYGIWLASGSGLVHHSFTSGATPDNNAVNAVTAVLSGDWYHVAATYDLEVSKVYIDGSLDSEAPFTATPNVTDVPVIMGRTPTDTYKYFGLIDEVAIFNAALSEDDINTIMTKGLQNSVAAVSPKTKLATTWGNIKY